MDTRNVPIDELTTNNTEIVGLNGQPNGYLGYSLPIVRYVPKNLFCALSYSRKPHLVWDSESIIQEMARMGRVTLFGKPLSPPTNLDTQYVVSWLDTSLLPILEQPNWTEKPPEVVPSGTHLFASESEDQIEALFKGYADAFCNLFDLSLSRLQTESGVTGWSYLQQIALVGLQAERDLAKRYWMYVRLGLSNYFNPSARPELAIQLFRGAVKPTYKNIAWEHFLNDMTTIFTRSQKMNIFTIPLRFESGPFIEKLHRQVWKSSITGKETATLSENRP